MPSNVRPLTGKAKPGASRVNTANRMLTLFSAAYIAITFVFSLGTPNLPSTSFGANKSPVSSRTRCDPFSLPGFVDWSIGSDEIPAWRTFDPACSTTNLFGKLISTLATQTRDPSRIAPHIAAKLASPESVQEINSFLANRTVLMIGDHQVDRALVSHFCELLGHTARAVYKHHPWGSSLTSVPPKHGVTPDSNNVPLAHYCYLEEYDFLLTSVYSYGIDTLDRWKAEPIYNAPGLFEDRVSDLFQPYMRVMVSSSYTAPNLPLPRQRAEPDLIVFNSGLFDLAGWARQDIDAGAGLLDNLSEERIMLWRSRMVDMLNSIRKAWRKPRIVWRNTALPLASEASTVEAFLGNDKAGKNHPLYHTNRIAQLNNAHRSAIEVHGDDVVKGEISRGARMPNNVVGLNFAEVVMGQDQKTLNPLQPNQLPCGALFAEMLLWHLRDAVL